MALVEVDRSYMTIVKFDECFDHPPVKHRIKPVHLKFTRIYKEVENELINRVGIGIENYAGLGVRGIKFMFTEEEEEAEYAMAFVAINNNHLPVENQWIVLGCPPGDREAEGEVKVFLKSDPNSKVELKELFAPSKLNL